MSSRSSIFVCALLMLAASCWTKESVAQKKYDPGASDTEIKIGNIMPYSGPASSYSIIGKTEAAYFNKISAEGGINGRNIKFVSYDDGYSPPKAIEQARKLGEQQVARALAFLGVADHDHHNMSSSVFDPDCVKTCTIERHRKFPQLTAQPPDSEGTNPH